MELVIGGSGFIGRHLVRELVQRGRAVKVYDLAAFPADETPQPEAVVQGDILDETGLREAMRGADVVYHLAANPNLWDRDPEVFDRVNRQGTETVLRAVAAERIPRLVYTSTESILAPRNHSGPIDENVTATVDDMIGPYCRSKFLAEQAVFQAAAAGLPAVVVNPTMPMGSGDRNLTPPGRMLRDYLEGKIRGYIDCTLNFLDVRDAAAGHVLAAEHAEPGRRYILAGHNVSVKGLLETAAEITGIPAPTMRVPYQVALVFSHLEEGVGRLTGRQPMSSVTGVKLCRRSMAFDGTATWQALGGHVIRPFKESLAEALDWHKAQMRAG
jgi:dihydroflavonol-4-reductase